MTFLEFGVTETKCSVTKRKAKSENRMKISLLLFKIYMLGVSRPIRLHGVNWTVGSAKTEKGIPG